MVSAQGAAEFWQKLASRSRSNLYFALAFLPPTRREAFRDVYRFLRAADDVVDSGLPAAESTARLRTWRHELDAVYAGRASHPTAARLADAVGRFHLSRAHFETILDALEADAAPREFATFAELEEWCAAVSGTLGLLCLEILEADSPGARRYARDLGVALQLANILRDVAEDAARGRVYLPADLLAQAGVGVPELLAGRPGPRLRHVAHALADEARARIRRAPAHLPPGAAAKLLVPHVWGAVYAALLDELERIDFDVFHARPELGRRRKLWIALRAAGAHFIRSRAHGTFHPHVG